MKKRKLTLLALTVATGGAITLGVTLTNKTDAQKFLAGSAVEWKHFTAVDATCENYGAKEYWTNCQGTTQLTKPGEGETVVEAGAADPVAIAKYSATDSRLVAPKGHNFNNATLNCEHEDVGFMEDIFETFENHPVNGTQRVTEDTEHSAPEGYGKLYKVTHTYNDYTSTFTLKNPFKAVDISEYSEFSFYVYTVVGSSNEWMWADDNGAYSKGFELHALAGANVPGTITAKNEGNGTWTLTATGFKFRDMSNGAQVTSFTYHNRNTLPELFAFPSGGWGTHQIVMSDIVGKKVAKCGAFQIDAFKNRNNLVEDTTHESTLGQVYHYNAIAKDLFNDIDITGFNTIKFGLANESSGNSFFLLGDTNSGYLLLNSPFDTIVAVNDGGNWTISRESGAVITKLPGWGGVANYTVEGATKLTDLFYTTVGYSTSVYVTDLVATGTNPRNIDVLTGALDASKLSIATIGKAKFGYGKLYTTSTVKNLVVNTIDVTAYSKISFYIETTDNNNAVMLKDLGGGTSNSTGGLYGGNKDIINAVKDGTTWTVTRASNGNFFELPSWDNVPNYQVTSVTNLIDIFEFCGNGSTFNISDIIAVK